MANLEDPLVTRSRREAVWVFFIWVAAMVYTVAYCYLYGYKRDIQSMRFVLWFPDWVFWGIIIPWCATTAVSIWFALCVMSDEDLGGEPLEEEDSFNA